MHKLKFVFHGAFSSHYKVLGLNPDATQAEIKQSYFQLAKKMHPDVNGVQNGDFIKIKNAYDILRNPTSRSLYDRQRVSGIKQNDKKYHYYYAGSENTQSSTSGIYSRLFITLSSIGICIIGYILIKKYTEPMTEHQIRRQNIILANQYTDSSPYVQQKRRKQLLIEMKQKRFSANVCVVKVSDGSQQSTKKKHVIKNSIQSIPGIVKGNKEKPADWNRQSYI